MSDIDFQNGFLCGMATKGLIKTAEQYKPNIWNDTGVYTYFYIDFKRTVADFSEGMLIESIVIHDTVQIPITDFEYVSPGVYKIFADISGKVKGVTVINKATSYLIFADGSKIPPFSNMFYIAGLDRYVRHYTYEKISNVATTAIDFVVPTVVTESADLELPVNTFMNEISESIYDAKSITLGFVSSVNEIASVALT